MTVRPEPAANPEKHLHQIDKFYIGGQWVNPAPAAGCFEMVDAATEQPSGWVAMGTEADVDRAVAAARAALPA